MPDLEAKRTETIVSINDDNNLLKEMEDKTLRMLNMSKGNILDDEELIETLNNSKVGRSKYLHLLINFIFVIKFSGDVYYHCRTFNRRRRNRTIHRGRS